MMSEINERTETHARDLISRQAAIDALGEWIRYGFIADRSGLKFAYEVIEELPSAQPEIIRCKDCKHWDGENCILTVPFTENSYCSDAERRTE